MAIIGPKDLPAVLKADSNPLKRRLLTHLGHPNIRVELTEEQMEDMLRTVGDFIAQYFPNEDRYAYFYTQPLESTYDLPEDAYWVREVSWDPVVNRIQDIFGAEMFLFCFADGFQIVKSDTTLIPVEDWSDDHMALTPYGPQHLKIIRHEQDQPLVQVSYEGGNVICTPNQPINTGEFDAMDSLKGWEIASQIEDCDVTGIQNNYKFVGRDDQDPGPTYTVVSPVGCFYGCHNGEPVLLH
jgi:hypothetical protein